MKSTLERGHQALKRISELWRIDAERMQWVDLKDYHNGAGFDWWPGDYPVVVRASFQNERNDGGVRISIRTDVLRDAPVASEPFEKMAALVS